MTSEPSPAVYAAPPRRPLGVAILAVLVGLFGLIFVLGGILLLATSAAAAYFGTGGFTSLLHASGAIAGAIVLVIGLIILGLALGLWHLRMWALALTLIILAVVLIAEGLAGAFVSFGFLVSLVLFIYLIAVNRHFR